MAAVPDDPDLAAAAVRLAADLLSESTRRRPRRERRRMARLARMVGDPGGTAFALAVTDEVLRIRDRGRAARRFRDLVADLGVPAFPGPVDRALLRAGATLAPAAPGLVMPLMSRRLRREGEGVVIPAEDRALARHIARRRRRGDPPQRQRARRGDPRRRRGRRDGSTPWRRSCAAPTSTTSR